MTTALDDENLYMRVKADRYGELIQKEAALRECQTSPKFHTCKIIAMRTNLTTHKTFALGELHTAADADQSNRYCLHIFSGKMEVDVIYLDKIDADTLATFAYIMCGECAPREEWLRNVAKVAKSVTRAYEASQFSADETLDKTL